MSGESETSIAQQVRNVALNKPRVTFRQLRGENQISMERNLIRASPVARKHPAPHSGVSRAYSVISMFATLLLGAAMCVVMGGCANRLKCDVAPDFVGKHTAVARLGITGGGTSAAIPAFQKAGYQVVDLGSGDDPVERAASKQIPFVASVEKVGTDGAWWDGFFDFSMRVTETQSQKVVWSASAEYGQGGVFINQTKSTEEAMRAMVADFAKHFPPGVPLPAAPDGKPTPAATGGPLKPLEVK